MSLNTPIITNRTVKPFTKMYDFYPGYKLEEECFSKAIITDPDSSKRKKGIKSKGDIETPTYWPRTKSNLVDNFG